ncbi:MAG: hypothetical protein IPM48_06285 [Saprospiraceae bacterium]|nr:hypothetical protein [Saprospiraceae bacterium]
MTLILGVLLSGAKLSCQVDEISKSMSLGVQNGFRASIPNASSKVIGAVWKKYTKDYGKLKKNKKASEEYIEGAIIQSIMPNSPMDIYTSIEDGYITAFFDTKSHFIGSGHNAQAASQAVQFMQEFAYEVQREMVREELETEQDQVRKLEKHLEKLKRDHTGYHKDIEDAKEKIRKAESNIITNEKDQVKTQTDIESQRKKVEDVQVRLNNIGKSR